MGKQLLTWGCAVSTVAAAMLIAWHAIASPATRVLEGVGLGNVRGSAAGGNCTANYTYVPCTETDGTGQPSTKSCWQNDGNQAGCNNQACNGCNGTVKSEFCTAGRPWNSLCNPNSGQNQNTGCGLLFVNPGCKWYANNSTCRCFSQNTFNVNCGQDTVAGAVGACVPVN